MKSWNDVLCAVDVLDLQPDHLAGAQPAAIAETEQRASLETAGHCQQPSSIGPVMKGGG
jgi:hypothetical protein